MERVSTLPTQLILLRAGPPPASPDGVEVLNAMPELILLSEGKPVLRCPLHGQSVSVGRSAANDISVPDESLPTLHCSFEPRGVGYQVVDRGGQGVIIGEDEYEHKDLAHGDEIRLGHLIARFDATH